MLNTAMPEFFASTSKGLIPILEKEIQDLDLKVIDKGHSGVTFETNWAGCYLANLKLCTANKVLKPILDFPAYQLEDLYHNTLKHDFTKYIGVNQTFAIDASLRASKITDQRMLALKVKDAIADQFRDKFGERPNVDAKDPDLRIVVRLVKNQASLALDTSGVPLSHRGYRTEQGGAPLREHLAAGLIKMTGWDGKMPLYDPMCGSGTFLIEAALMAQKMAPGLLRKHFAFQNWTTFQEEAWNEVLDKVVAEEAENPELKLYGSDIIGKMSGITKANAGRAGVLENIEVFRKSVMEIMPPCEETGMIIVNPPYGERLGITEELKDVYRDLSFQLRQHFKGWTLWILSGNEDLTGALKMKATKSYRVYNGNIECRFLEYKIR